MHSSSIYFVWASHPSMLQFWWYKCFFFFENQYLDGDMTWESRLCEWTGVLGIDCSRQKGAFFLRSTARHVWPTGRTFFSYYYYSYMLHVCACVYTVSCNQGHVLASSGYCSPVTRFCWYWTYWVMGTHYSMLDAMDWWERILEKLLQGPCLDKKRDNFFHIESLDVCMEH